MNELTTDESNDVVFMEETGPKSFKNLFSHERKESDTKQVVSKEIISSAKDADHEKEKQHKDDKSKPKNDGNGATKQRTDWDMFAEQDIDSNFDVRNIA